MPLRSKTKLTTSSQKERFMGQGVLLTLRLRKLIMGNPDAEEIFKDAEELYHDAVRELERGKIRDAAEKAWGATVRATDALILARTKERALTHS